MPALRFATDHRPAGHRPKGHSVTPKAISASLLVLSTMALAVGVAKLWRAPGTDPILIVAVVLGAAALICLLIVLTNCRRVLARLTGQTLRDPLTGLANRLQFGQRLRDALQPHGGNGRTVAVLTLDLHDFALVNKNLGHQTGDALLKSIADRLAQRAPARATVARLSDDCFAILIPDAPDPEGVAQVMIDAFNEPFRCADTELIVYASMGLATTRPHSDQDVGADELVRRSELARYQAKRSGLGGIQSWHPDIPGLDSAPVPSQGPSAPRTGMLSSDIQILGQLRRAIDNRGLALVYQPKIALTSGTRVGVEALVRWPHPDLGLLLPDQFLPLVRHHGLMAAVTDVVLDQAIGDAATWRASGADEMSVAVNLFAPSLTDTTLPDRIHAALAVHRLPARLLTVEITEHFLLTSLDRAQAVVRDLRDIGVRIAIDDFGSGYATMSYLQDLPIDELKLDRQFIAPVLSNVRSAAIVRSIIDLSHVLGITSVAEGVENEATASWLRGQHCDVAQGYYFSKPVPACNIHA